MNSPMHALAGVMTEKFILSAPEAAARALESLATHEVLLLISSLKAQVVVAALNPMDPPKAAAVLRRLPIKQASYILARLSVPQAARLMKEFSAPYQERISAVLDPAFVKLLRNASSFGPDRVGALMQTDVVSVRTEAKLTQLIERLKSLPRKKIPAICLVTDKENVLKGVIRPAELAFYSAQSAAGSVMTPSVFLLPQDDMETTRQVFAKEGGDVLPVADEKGVVLGILSRFSLPPLVQKKSFWKRFTT